MSDMNASVQETSTGFQVTGYEKIEYDFTFLDGVFNPSNPQLAKCYERWGRALAVTDMNVYNMYGEQMETYFNHYNIELKVHKTKIGEKAKTIPTFLSIVDSMTEFGIYRKVRGLQISVHATRLTVNRSQYLSLVVALSLMLLGEYPKSMYFSIQKLCPT